MIDVSAYQHPNGEPINWHEVAGAGIRAVMIKATEGLGYVNPWVGRDSHGARAAGLHVGFYHFAQPSHSTPAEQAAFCLKHITGLPRDIGVALDDEVTAGMSWVDKSEWDQQFIDNLAGVANRQLYSNLNFLDNLPGAPWGHLLWLAQYGVSAPRRHCWAWQYGSGRVPGVPAEVDLNRLYL